MACEAAPLRLAVVNNRRRALRDQPEVKLTSSHPCVGCQERQKLVLELNLDKQLSAFRTTDGRTQADVYTVFECSVDPKKARVALETDAAPMLVAERLVGLDQRKPNYFYVPAYGGFTWPEEAYPRFDTWLYAATRYPIYDENKQVIPRMNQTLSVSAVDRLECLSSLLEGTLRQFVRTSEPRYALLAWQVYRTFQNVMSRSGFLKTDPYEHLALLKTLIETRDGSRDDAVRYKKLIQTLHPASYYLMMYRIMQEHPETVHKSRVVNPETLIWGLLTLNLVSKEQLQDQEPATWAASFLRLFLERGLTRKVLPSRIPVTDEASLVEWCHRQMSSKLQYVMQQASISWSVCQALYKQPSVSADTFRRFLEATQMQLATLEGVVPACLVLCPTTTLNNKLLAEMWLAAAECESKTAVLGNCALETQATPRLHQILQQLQATVRQAQRRVEEMKQTVTVSQNPAGLYHSWIDQWKQSGARHIFSRAGTDYFCQRLYALASSGTKEHLPFYHYLETHGFLSDRRIRTIICISAPPGSELYDYYTEARPGFHVDDEMLQGRKWQWYWLLNHRVQVSEDVVVEDTKIQFIPFERAREMAEEIGRQLSSSFQQMNVSECLICLEESRQPLVSLHDEPRHAVCHNCADKLSHCPFCRCPL